MAGFDTLRIHAGYDSKENADSINVPIYQTAAFDLETIESAEKRWGLEEASGIYTRIGNPTVWVLEKRIAALDGGSAAVAFATGMAAITNTLMLISEGVSGHIANIVAPTTLYGAAHDALTHFLPKFGIETRFVRDASKPENFEKEIDINTRAIYLETISNPNADIYDYEDIADVAHRHSIPLIVDNTIATPYLFRPFENGADVIIYSATKGIAGHGNVLAGLVVESGKFKYSKEKYPQFYRKLFKIRDKSEKPRSIYEAKPDAPLSLGLKTYYLSFLGAALDPFAAFLVLQGLDTVSERLKKESENAEKIVKFLDRRKEVLLVRYPSARLSQYHELQEKYFPKGAGPVFTFGFLGDREQLDRFFRALKVFSYHVNIGDVRSIISNTSRTTHAELDSEELDAAGITQQTVRISAGIEDADDLIADLAQAFEAAFR